MLTGSLGENALSLDYLVGSIGYSETNKLLAILLLLPLIRCHRPAGFCGSSALLTLSLSLYPAPPSLLPQAPTPPSDPHAAFPTGVYHKSWVDEKERQRRSKKQALSREAWRPLLDAEIHLQIDYVSYR